MSELDISLYDRQIRTYGEEAVKKMVSSSVVIIGLEGGLATEVGKNLALGGIKNIYLYDNTLVNEKDIETGYYYNIESIGKPRSESLKNKLQELNNYSNIKVITEFEECPNDCLFIFCNYKLNLIHEVLSKNNNQMILGFSKGCAGSVFVDAGDNHIIIDKTSGNIEHVQIGQISDDGKVLVAENT